MANIYQRDPNLPPPSLNREYGPYFTMLSIDCQKLTFILGGVLPSTSQNFLQNF